MKIFAIRDEEDQSSKDLAYLIHYELEKKFYIELPEGADPWETPLILSSFAKKGIWTVNSYWSKLWVQQRIIPTDRQNLGMILKENGLDEYDEFKLLMLAEGRCAQDSYYLEPVDHTYLYKRYAERFFKRIEDVIPLKNNSLLIFFKNGEVKKFDVNRYASNDRTFAPVLNNEELFKKVSLQTGGYGICWGENVLISYDELYKDGIMVPLSKDDFLSFVKERIISTTEVTELMGCTRQYVNELTKKGKIHPVKEDAKTKYYLKSEILQRMWR
ncbi:MAG: DUF2442 domain-containing protein [Dorea sp.]|nr:DUF2442 domain-containing protein [Dorea sp.]